MVSNEELEQRLKSIADIFYVKVEGDGYQYHITIVSDQFLEQSKITRQRWVYAQLSDYITSGKLHAINMKTLTKEEWREQRG